MAISKVILNGITQIDLTQDTVNAASSLSGVTGHGANGEEFTGSYVAPHGTKTITENGTGINVTEYASVDVNIPTGTARTSSDLTVSGATVTVPAGLYSEQATKSVASGTAGTPSATKGTVSNHSVTITPSVTNTTGYITGGTKTGTAITVSANELVSGTYSVTSSGTKDVTNYASISVAAGIATTPATTISVIPSISVNSSGVITATANGTESITPTVSEGYVSTGTAGTITISGSNTSQLSTQAATTITPNSSQQTAVAAGKYTTGAVIVNPIPSSYVQPTSTKGATTYNTSTTDQTIASGTYLTGTQTIKAVKVTGLAASSIASGVTIKVGDANDDDRITSVTGTFTSDANATAADIISGKSGYVNGVKVNGSLVVINYYTGSSAPSNSLGSNGDIYLQTTN